MKIKVVHAECGREVLVHQILDSQGHCPWDGKPFNKDYTGVLARALEAAERFGGALEAALDRIVGTGGRDDHRGGNDPRPDARAARAAEPRGRGRGA